MFEHTDEPCQGWWQTALDRPILENSVSDMTVTEVQSSFHTWLHVI
jgi:hypothetical protein